VKLESKYLFIAATAVVLVLAIAGAPAAAADVAASRPAIQPGAGLPPKTLKAVKALLAKAELVVLGKVAAVYDRTARDAGMRYDIEVEKVLKGKWEKKSLSFRSSGWVGYAKYTKGLRVLLFLRRWGDRQPKLLQLKPVVYISPPQAGGLDLRPVEKYLKLIKSLQPGGNKLPTERAKLLKKHIGQFMLVIRYYGRQDKDKPYYSLTLQVPTVRDTRSSFWPAAQLSKAQAQKIIDHLDRIGILATAGNLPNKGFAPPKGPTYALTITGPNELRLYEPLGWDLRMLKRLDALRKVLDGDATKAMDQLLKALEPQRKKWRQLAASFVKRMKASKRVLNLALRHHPADPRQRHAYPNLHLYWAVDAPAKLPEPMIGMSKREALAAIDALDKAGYFEIAGDVTWRRAARTLAPWPVHKGPCYSLTVSSDTTDCHAGLGWDLKMIEHLDAMRKALDKGSDAGKAMDKVIKALQPQRKKWQTENKDKLPNGPTPTTRKAAGGPASGPAPAIKRTAERAKLLKKRVDSFRLTLRWHTTQGKSLSPGQSLQLTTVEGDYDASPFFATVVITKQRAGKIIEHLAVEGFLERASDVKDAKSYPVPKLKSYSLTVRTTFGPHLYEHMPWGLNLLKRVEGLRKVMAGNREAVKVIDKILAPLKLMPAAGTARPACIAALRKIQKDFAVLATKYPKDLGHLGPGTIDDKKLLLRFPVKGLANTTQPARRATSAGGMRSFLRPLQPNELGLFVQFTVPMPKQPMARWLYSNVGLSWWWMWSNRPFSSKAQQDFLNMLNKALAPLNELESAMVATDLPKRKTGAYVLRGRPGVKLSLQLAPKRTADGSEIIDLYVTNETKKPLALCPPFPQVIVDGKPWHYRPPDALSMLIRAFDGGKDPFIYIKPGQNAKVGAVAAVGLSPGRHTVHVAVCHARDTWLDQRPAAYDGPPITRKIPGAWTGVLVSKELAVDIPAPAAPKKTAAERAKLLKKNTGMLYLILQYHLGYIGAKPSLHLATGAYKIELIGGILARLTPKEAANIIDHLAKEGFLAQAENVVGKDITPPQGPAYTLTLMGAGQTKLYQVLGWDLKMLRRLDALRKALDKESDAGKAMDKLLKALEPQRKKWRTRAPRDDKSTIPTAYYSAKRRFATKHESGPGRRAVGR